MRDFETGLTAALLREELEYDPATGHFYRLWPVMGGPNRCAIQCWPGERAGTLSKSDGYRYIQLSKRIYSEHRLAWLYMTGEWPEHEVDHKDGKRDNNRWDNLRQATIAQNRRNTLGQRSRKGPYPGVYEQTNRPGRFVAQIKVNRRVLYLGVFGDIELARAARLKAERLYFGEFAGSERSL